MKHILLFFATIFLMTISVNAQSINSNGFEKKSTAIHPNPATSQINIKFDEPNKVAYVAIYSIIGNEVLNRKVDQPNAFKLNVQNLKKGKYIVRVINTDGSSESLSLIKN